MSEKNMISNLKFWMGLVGVLSLNVVPIVANAANGANGANSTCPALLDHTFSKLQDGKPMPLCQYQGKVILVVNTASYCGFTSQYDGLEKLNERLKDKGLVVLGFPSNEFGEQEPGSNKEIADFCRLTYGVLFAMVGKTSVKGKGANPFYKQLAEITGSTPQWNFHKYLINRDGSKVVAFESQVTPEDKALLNKIDEFLK
jgi:glutathione peroxidase